MSPPKGDVGQLIRQRLKPGDVAIDVGAWSGSETDVMVGCVGPTGHVFAIEPRLAQDSDLARRTLAWPTVTILPVALDARTGLRALHPGPGGQSSFFRDLVPTPDPACEVPTLTLDAVTSKTVALVKLDVQGAEGAVLEGAPRVLTECPAWIVELWPHGLRTAGTSARIVCDRFWAAGYVVRWADGEPMTPDTLDAWIGQMQKQTGYVNITADRP